MDFGMFITAIYGKIVRCSFKSFEQCILQSQGSVYHSNIVYCHME